MNKPAPFRVPTPPRPLLALMALTSALWTGGAGAVTVYRCGAAGNSFSDMPCADGRAFEAADVRSEAQRAEATRVAAIDRQLADELQADRLRAAAAATPQRAAGFDARPQRQTVTPVRLAADGHRINRKLQPTARSKPRWIYDEREEFTALAPTAAGKPRRR